jgi:AcrR family transcriptional regulator
VPKDSIELMRARKEEIICAFEQLFQEKSVRSISMREIGAKTSFARSSIYNYFQTKEEIQLGLTIREFTAWKDALQKILENENKNILQFAEAIAAFLADRNQFIKLISWNHYEIEENSRPERLAEMQQGYL